MMLPCIQFRRTKVNEVIAAVWRVATTMQMSCILDVLPMPELKSVVDVIAPFPCELLNRSMSTALLLAKLKSTYVPPLLKKKQDFDVADVRLYRRI